MCRSIRSVASIVPLVGCVDGSLELRIVQVLSNVGWDMGTGHRSAPDAAIPAAATRRSGIGGVDWSGNGVLVVFLEPHDQAIDRFVDTIPVSESIWCYRHILNPGLGPRLIAEAELARELFGCTKEIRNAFRVFCFFIFEKFLQFFIASSVSFSVVFVDNEVSGEGGHGLYESSQYLVQIFICLRR